MRRAYAVILWLPPDRIVGEGLDWEIEQVVQRGLQTRTIIVLPPPDKRVAYQRAVKQAATLLATMETATGLAVHANPLRVQHYEGVLGSNTVTMKFVRARDGDGLRLIRRFAGDLPRLTWQQMLVNLPLLWGSPLVWDPRRKKRINALVYESGLASLLTIVGKELADQPFPVRYPSPEPGSAGEILSDPTRRTEYDRKLNAEVDPRSASGSDASDDPRSGEPPADDADEEPEAFNIRVAPQTIDFGIVKTGGPNVNAEVVLSWDGGSPNLIRRFPPGGDWWDIRDAASGIGRVTFKVSAQAYDGIPSGRHSSYFDIVVDDVVYRVGLVMAIIDSRKPNGRYTRTARRSPILASKEIFAYRVSWLLATVAALLISEYIEHFFNPTGSPSEVLVSIGGIWNLVIIIYGLCRTFRRNRLIVIPSSKKLWTFASFAVTIFIASIVLIWTYKNGISGWAS
jgi:hypothetical protein